MVKTVFLIFCLPFLFFCPAFGEENKDGSFSEKPVERIAFGSCLGQDLPQPIWTAILETDPNLFVFLGDNVYADTHDMSALKATYAKLAAQPGFQKLRDSVRILATWDDHDYGSNDSGSDNPTRAESQKIFLDFWNTPQDSPRRKREGIYDAQIFGPPGKRLQIILLDTRYFRSPLKSGTSGEDEDYIPNTDPNATILGEKQWRWFEEQLLIPAQVRIVASSIQVVGEDHGSEKWANFPNERKKLFDLIWKTRVTGLFFISGDMHFAELSMVNGDVGFPIYDLTSSSLNWSDRHWQPLYPNKNRVATMRVGDNFGFIEINWNVPDPILRLQIRDEEGDIMIQYKMPLSNLREGTWY